MYICTCNNCGNCYEDTNPGNDSVKYPEVILPALTLNPDNFAHECPECGTDGYLVDNVNPYIVNTQTT